LPLFFGDWKIWLPSDNGGLLDGDQIFSITIGSTPTMEINK
jgi:hypothetical protein